VSFTSNDSGATLRHVFPPAVLYAALVAQSHPLQDLDQRDITDTRYRENDGINRVNQNLIDNSTYLTAPAAQQCGWIWHGGGYDRSRC